MNYATRYSSGRGP